MWYSYLCLAAITFRGVGLPGLGLGLVYVHLMFVLILVHLILVLVQEHLILVLIYVHLILVLI